MGNFEAKKVGKEMGHFGSSDGCMASDKDRKVSSGENNYGRRLTTVDVNDGQGSERRGHRVIEKLESWSNFIKKMRFNQGQLHLRIRPKNQRSFWERRILRHNC
ncbi:hypothetical protein QYF36_017501 [Acer negundo]|nr:hypothetical protein QYF36_017501 [Acer negundo]